MNVSAEGMAALLANYGPGIAAFLAVFVAGLIARKILLSRLEAWTSKTASRVDDALISSIRRPMVIWVVMLAAYAALEVSAWRDDIVAIVEKCLFVLLVFSISLAIANLAAKLIEAWGAQNEGARSATSLTKVLSRILILLIGILVILNFLGVSITPMIASLGVGGLAVALALQDTLANCACAQSKGLEMDLAMQYRVIQRRQDFSVDR